MSVTVGLRGEATAAVTAANTAAACGSGHLEVFGTPYLIALMEEAACRALAPVLEPGQGSVGTRLDVHHDAPTPVGGQVRAEAEITAVDGRRITFRVAAWDAAGPVGGGTHERFLIRETSFLAKAEARLTP